MCKIMSQTISNKSAIFTDGKTIKITFLTCDMKFQQIQKDTLHSLSSQSIMCTHCTLMCDFTDSSWKWILSMLFISTLFFY